jgi:opacity protein-like surface antigen
MSRKTMFLFSLLLLAPAPPSQAGSTGRSYVFFGGGYSSSQTFGMPVFLEAGEPPALTADVETGAGARLNLGYGYRVGETLRVEGEAGYRFYSVDNVRLLTFLDDYQVPPVDADVTGGEGDIRSVSLLLNAWYDTVFAAHWIVYFGGGLGLDRTALDNFAVTVTTSEPQSERLYTINDAGWDFAYQLGIGLSYDMTAHAALDLSYRYLVPGSAHLEDMFGNEIAAGSRSSNLQVAVRYSF